MQSGASCLIQNSFGISYKNARLKKKEAECIINEIKPGDETRQEQNVQVQNHFSKYHNKRNRSNEDDDVAITKNCNMIDHRTNQPTNQQTDRMELRIKSKLHRYVKAKHTKCDLFAVARVIHTFYSLLVLSIRLELLVVL